MEFATISGAPLKVSRVGLGTQAIGGWMWGGTDEEESVKTIRASVERGITLIDTAPAYGFGRSEEIVGRALADAGLRSRVVIATKVLPTEGHGTKFIGRVPRGGSIVHLPDWKKVGAR